MTPRSGVASRPADQLRVALVHYWLTTWGGGERVLRAIADLFPQADIFTVVANEKIATHFQDRCLKTSFVQNIPGSVRWHRYFVLLYPFALEQFDFRNYDLVISSDSGPAHGVLTPTSTCHISYCHSPMRYVWDFYHDYINGQEVRAHSRWLFAVAAHYLRLWDVNAAARVDFFAANSHNVAARIHKHYRRQATVIYPPVNVSHGYGASDADDYYLFVGRLVDYKRADLAIEACTRMQRRLRVVGVGPQWLRLRKMAGKTVEFLGELSEDELQRQYAGCRALLFPGEEDFGMVPVEAQSFGKPVIAYGRGGVLESISGAWCGERVLPEEHTGIFFAYQSVDSVCEAIRVFEENDVKFSSQAAIRQAQNFSVERFEQSLLEFVAKSMHTHSTCLFDTPALRRGGERLHVSGVTHDEMGYRR